MESLKEKTAKGLFWGALNNVMLQVIGVTMGIVMGRLLNATDYGMIAMISIFALVANDLQNSGFKAALNNIKQPQHRDYNSVFWFNIAMGGGLYVLLFFLAPLIASYYHTPELIPLCPLCLPIPHLFQFRNSPIGLSRQEHHGQTSGQSQPHRHLRV